MKNSEGEIGSLIRNGEDKKEPTFTKELTNMNTRSAKQLRTVKSFLPKTMQSLSVHPTVLYENYRQAHDNDADLNARNNKKAPKTNPPVNYS